MADQQGFPLSGEWLRCALHAHTTNSDGDLPPAKLVNLYERAGYDVLCLTDHWVRTAEPSTERLLVIPGVELNATVVGTGSDAHVLGIGIERDPVEPDGPYPDLDETVAWIHEAQGLPFLAHSYWSGLLHEEFADCEGLLGLEVWNSSCEVEIGRGVSGGHWDEALERGSRLTGLATDDTHHPGGDSDLGWVWARCTERSHAGVLAALETGAFYSSCGPVIDEIRVEDGSVWVTCTPAASITLLCGRMSGARVNAGRLGHCHRGRITATTPDGSITAARLTPEPDQPFGRVEVADALGRKAWTNSLW
jgi:hypothetical protein